MLTLVSVVALCKLYDLQDPRLAEVQVKGDLVVTQSNRIMTRSRARAQPDQYTSVSAQLKIIKVLVEELDVAVVDSLCDILADLVGASPLNHVVARPSVLGLGAR